MLKRVVCFSLVLVLLLAAFPHALADGFSVSFSFCTVENGGTARQGDTVRFEISAPGAVLTQMMIVPPDSSRNGMDGPVCEVELNAPGTWAFVAYAQDSAGNTVHSSQWRINVQRRKATADELVQQFREWACSAYDKYLQAERYKEEYFAVSDIKVEFDKGWWDDKKAGSTNEQKNENYEDETRKFYLYALSQSIMNKADEIINTDVDLLESYFPGAKYDMVTQKWVADPVAMNVQKTLDFDVSRKIEERNTELAAIFVKALMDDIFLVTGAFENNSKGYKIKNRCIDILASIAKACQEVDTKNERNALANELREVMVNDLVAGYSNINDVVFEVVEDRKSALEKRNRNSLSTDDRLLLDVMTQVVGYKQTVDEKLLFASNNQTGSSRQAVYIEYDGQLLSVADALTRIAEDAVSELGINEAPVIRNENQIFLLKLLYGSREVVKGGIKLVMDFTEATDKAGEHLAKGTLGQRIKPQLVQLFGSSVTEVGLEVLIDAVVDIVFENLIIPEKIADYCDANPEIDSSALQGYLESLKDSEETNLIWALIDKLFSLIASVENAGNNMVSTAWKQQAVWNKTIEEAADEFDEAFQRLLEEFRNLIGEELSEESQAGLKNSHDLKMEKLKSAQHNYLSDMHDRLSESNKWYVKYANLVKKNPGFVSSAISNLISLIGEVVDTLWNDTSDFGDTLDEDPMYAVYANGMYRIKQMAEKEMSSLHPGVAMKPYFMTADPEDIRKEINRLYAIMNYHVTGHSLYITLDTAYWAERDPAHRQEVWDSYMDYAQRQFEAHPIASLTYLWAIELAGKLDADSKSEFLKRVEKDRCWLSSESCIDYSNHLTEGMNELVIPPQFAPLFDSFAY